MTNSVATPEEFTQEYALDMDSKDELHHFRGRFYFPQKPKPNSIYFCGNSLGLQPKTAHYAIEQELNDWRDYAVEGHFLAKHPWFDYHKNLVPSLSRLLGCLDSEAVPMNTLTANIHLLMTSFYRPDSKRSKILIEGNAFPSDHYAVETQTKLHGIDPNTGIVELFPRSDEFTIRDEDIIGKIHELGESLSFILLGAVQYQTGQFFDIPSIVDAAHQVGAVVCLDLAHAIGNVELKLHEWDVDCAVWCSYKYLNSGPGGVGGLYVHEKHGNNDNLLRLGGWWGVPEETRFLMKKGFIPAKGAQGWQLSNAQVFQMAALKASLDIFDEAGLGHLTKKSERLTGYAERLINDVVQHHPASAMKIITPSNPKQRGAQLSIAIESHGKDLHRILTSAGVISDWREPNIIRIAPVPLYNSYYDVFMFAQILRQSAENLWS